nr:MAG TPA: hypothetical protein [Caudoviricetes sp.]
MSDNVSMYSCASRCISSELHDQTVYGAIACIDATGQLR